MRLFAIASLVCLALLSASCALLPLGLPSAKSTTVSMPFKGGQDTLKIRLNGSGQIDSLYVRRGISSK